MSRKRNWSHYNKQLVQRGSITFLIDHKLFKSKISKTGGRPQIFSDSLISMLMMVKIHYHLAYRALQGFAQSFTKYSIPSYSLICKRARKLKLPALSQSKASVVAIDASGVKVYGEGEWKVKIHGKSKRRRWVKIHIAIDTDTGEIVAQTTTQGHVHDGQMTEVLLSQMSDSVDTVLADGAYDGRASREAITKRGARGLIPPPKNGRIRNKDPQRDDALRIIRAFGGDRAAKSLWGKMTGYSRRVLVESVFSRMKRLFGHRLFSKRTDSQSVENHFRCILLNKMNALAS